MERRASLARCGMCQAVADKGQRRCLLARNAGTSCRDVPCSFMPHTLFSSRAVLHPSCSPPPINDAPIRQSSPSTNSSFDMSLDLLEVVRRTNLPQYGAVVFDDGQVRRTLSIPPPTHNGLSRLLGFVV